MSPGPRTPLAPALAGAVTTDDLGVLVAAHHGDPTGEYLALRRDAGLVDRSHRGSVLVEGPDAVRFLHALLSADVAGLADGQGTHALLLQPQGKLEVDLRLLRLGDACWLDTEPGFGAPLAAALGRLRIRTKADIVDRTGAVGCVTVRGPGAAERLAALGAPVPVDPHAHGPWDGTGVRVVRADWPGSPGLDLVGAVDDLAAVWTRLVDAGLRPCGLLAAEAVRIEAGVPRQGLDVGASTIPQEAFLEVDAVSFTKGCFVGQELVCRIDTRGRVNRYLRGVRVLDAVVPPRGAEVVADGTVVGTVTSVAESLDLRAPVALATVRREVEPPCDVVLRWDGGQVPARVEAVPLVP